jgi:hypothetical protein
MSMPADTAPGVYLYLEYLFNRNSSFANPCGRAQLKLIRFYDIAHLARSLTPSINVSADDVSARNARLSFVFPLSIHASFISLS